MIIKVLLSEVRHEVTTVINRNMVSLMDRQWSIWVAAKLGDWEAVEEIIEGGTDINIQNLNR